MGAGRRLLCATPQICVCHPCHVIHIMCQCHVSVMSVSGLCDLAYVASIRAINSAAVFVGSAVDVDVYIMSMPTMILSSGLCHVVASISLSFSCHGLSFLVGCHALLRHNLAVL